MRITSPAPTTGPTRKSRPRRKPHPGGVISGAQSTPQGLANTRIGVLFAFALRSFGRYTVGMTHHAMKIIGIESVATGDRVNTAYGPSGVTRIENIGNVIALYCANGETVAIPVDGTLQVGCARD